MYNIVLLNNDENTIKDIKDSFNWRAHNMKVVKTFSDPRSVIEYADKHNVDAVFTDIKNTKMSGFKLIEKLKNERLREDILFVIISSCEDFEYMRKCIELGVVDYCKSPIDKAQTDDVLKRLEKRLKERVDSKLNEEAISSKNFQDLLKYVSENYNKNLTLKELATMFYFNRNYLCILFKKKLGMKFSDYLQKVRMQEAKRLFDKESLTVSEVSSRVGYNYYSYFNKVFTDYYGITPKAYKKRTDSRKSLDDNYHYGQVDNNNKSFIIEKYNK